MPYSGNKILESYNISTVDFQRDSHIHSWNIDYACRPNMPKIIPTFGDNWEEQLQYVKPILDKYGFK